MDTLENAKLTTIFNITKFLILGIPIFNSKDQDTEGRKKKNTGNCKAFWVTRKCNNSYQTEIKLLTYFVNLLRLKSFTAIFHDFLATGKNSKTFISSFSLMLRATVESIPFHYQQLAIAKVQSSSYIHWIKPYDLINEESRTTDRCFYCLNVSMLIMNIRNE